MGTEEEARRQEIIDRLSGEFRELLQDYAGKRVSDVDTRELASKAILATAEVCGAKIDVRPDPNTPDRIIITIHPPYTLVDET